MPEGHRPKDKGVYIRLTTSAHVITSICHLVPGNIEPRMQKIKEKMYNPQSQLHYICKVIMKWYNSRVELLDQKMKVVFTKHWNLGM